MSRALLSAVILLTACGDSTPKAARVASGIARFELHPPVAGLGTQVAVTLTSSRSSFDFGKTDLVLGDGVAIETVTVRDGFETVAQIAVADDATLGLRDAVIEVDGLSWTLEGAFSVVPESVQLEPDNAKLGEMVEVRVTGLSTHFESGYTWASFGDGVDILAVEVLSETEAIVQLSVHPDALPGDRDVAMENGPQVVTNYDGFNVDRVALTAVFDPPQAFQNTIVNFIIEGKDTAFLQGELQPQDTGMPQIEGQSMVQFWDGGGPNADVTIRSLTVIDGDSIAGSMQISNAAALGFRSLFVTGTEDLLVPEALEILPTTPDIGNVAVGLGFDIERQIDNATGDIDEDVDAFAYFVIPLNPPCYQPSNPGSGPDTFDANGVYAIPDPLPSNDCPNPLTVSAGDVVWLESDQNVVTLHKQVIEATGQIIYTGQGLTLADYPFDTWFDLHAPGDPPFGTPEFLVERVLPTVPKDYQILTPELWGDYPQPRAEEFAYTWNPASTYPVATFGTSITGILEADGGAGFIAALPWDDGAHSYSPAELLLLAPGPVTFDADVTVDGPRFGLPFSYIQTNQAGSSVSVRGSLVLE